MLGREIKGESESSCNPAFFTPLRLSAPFSPQISANRPPPLYVFFIFLFPFLLFVISPLSHSSHHIQCIDSLPVLISCPYSYRFFPLTGACPPLCECRTLDGICRHVPRRFFSPLPIRLLFSTATSSARPLTHTSLPSFLLQRWPLFAIPTTTGSINPPSRPRTRSSLS